MAQLLLTILIKQHFALSPRSTRISKLFLEAQKGGIATRPPSPHFNVGEIAGPVFFYRHVFTHIASRRRQSANIEMGGKGGGEALLYSSKAAIRQVLLI